MKAKAVSSFGGQLMYSAKGISFLGKDDWVKSKDVTLGLYTMAVQATSCLGDFETMKRYCSVVLKQGNCSILDQLPCYRVWVESLGRSGNFKEAIDFGIRVLHKLGCKFPRTNLTQTLSAATAIIGCKQRLKKITPSLQDLSEMSLMPDPVPVGVVDMLHQISRYAFHSHLKHGLDLGGHSVTAADSRVWTGPVVSCKVIGVCTCCGPRHWRLDDGGVLRQAQFGVCEEYAQFRLV